MIVKKFVNELGNSIKLKIKNKRKTDSNYKTKEKITFTGVSITIQGPSRETENVVTREEAEELYKCLGQFLYA